VLYHGSVSYDWIPHPTLSQCRSFKDEQASSHVHAILGTKDKASSYMAH
jgi:hypothetical protein